MESDRDPGLQPERTRLAWRRTTLSCAVTAVLAMRQVVRNDGGAVVAGTVVALAALVFLAFLRIAHVRIQHLGAPRPSTMSARTAVVVVACTAALAVFGAAVVW